MYILAITGSPREGGNTDILMDAVAEGVRERSPECLVERIRVDDLGLTPCRWTLACRKTGECIIDDGMRQVLRKIAAADGLIPGSPIYRGYLSGQMKVFMDRATPLERDRSMADGNDRSMK